MIHMLRFYAADAVHAALDAPRLVAALERAFREGAQVPLRHVHRLGGNDTGRNDTGSNDSLLLMPAWRDAQPGTAGALGVKIVTVMPGAVAHGGSTVAALYVLLDRTTGEPRAVIDGEALTQRRTAAASALAARYMARADASTLLVVGTGKLAPYMLRAHCALRPQLVRLRLWGRNAAATQAQVQALRAEGLAVEVASDLQAAVRESHIICCATTATTPVVHGDWLSPGTHLDLVGGFTRGMREVDDAAVARARIVVDTYAGALAEAGDLVVPLETGVITRERIVAELGELVRGERDGRSGAEEITLFKSVGTALEDLAAAELVAVSG
jgi:ornithine cyclodeaminase